MKVSAECSILIITLQTENYLLKKKKKKNVIGNNRVRVYTPENIKNFSPFPLVNDLDFSGQIY